MDRTRWWKRALKYVGIVVASVVVLLTVYGVLIEPRLILDERHYEIELDNLGGDWDGAEVAVISDFQVGMWFDNAGMIERVVNRIIEKDPAAALIAGDFLYSESPAAAEQIETVLELLAPLREADIPIYAVLGNHDYEVGAAEELAAALEAQGIEVLTNEATVVALGENSAPSQALHVVGIGPAYSNVADIDEAFAEVPPSAPRIVMMHNPDTFPDIPPSAAPIAVAGHTHCGQIATPFSPRWSWLALAMDRSTIVDGFAPENYGASGNALFVTCGIGFSVIPVRINAPPQLVFFELLPAE